MQNIVGRKGGSQKQHTPKQDADTLHSLATARILLALGEGEFAGGVTDKDIYLDGTPIANPDGSVNFPGVKWEFRRGTQDQTFITGVPSVENEHPVNVDLKQGTAWVQSFSNLGLSAISIRLAVSALYEQKTNGDIVGTKVDYKIELRTDGGSPVTVLNSSFNGKASSLYARIE